MCRPVAPARQRLEALGVSLFAMHVVDTYIDVARGKIQIPSAIVVAYAVKKLSSKAYRNYCEAVIYEDIARHYDRDYVKALMLRTELTHDECEFVINYWHKVQKRAMHYSSFMLPRPDFNAHLGAVEE